MKPSQEYRFEFFCVLCGKPVGPKDPTTCPECKAAIKQQKEAPAA